MATKLVKNNRDETLAGDITFEANVDMHDAHVMPPLITVSLPTLNASHSVLIPIYNDDDELIAYVKGFPQGQRILTRDPCDG